MMAAGDDLGVVRVGDMVLILDTQNALEEFPEGVGKQFLIQQCVDGGIYLVEGRYLVAEDVHKLGVGDLVEIRDTQNAREEFPEGIGKQFMIQQCIDGGLYVVEDRRKWEINLDGDWTPWAPHVFFRGVEGEEIAFELSGVQYIAHFTSRYAGFQQNLKTKTKRWLRNASYVVEDRYFVPEDLKFKERKWEISLDGKWTPWAPPVFFRGVEGEEIAFELSCFQYIAQFTSRYAGFQQNLKTKTKRWLRNARRYEDLRDPTALVQYCKDTGLKLVGIPFLQESARSDRPLQRRLQRCQDIRFDEFVPVEAIHIGPYTKHPFLLVVSHPWHTKIHPDPSGIKPQQIIEFLEERRRIEFGNEFGECVLEAAFIDYSSLPQRVYDDSGKLRRERSPEESVIFKAGLEDMHVLYAHDLTCVLMLTGQLPPTVDSPVPYARRGWCCFEQRVANLKSYATQPINLRDYDGQENALMKANRLFEEGNPFAALEALGGHPIAAVKTLFPGAGQGSIGILMPPEDFHAFVRTAHFTNGTDANLVAQLYRKVFKIRAGCTRELFIVPESSMDFSSACTALGKVLHHYRTLNTINFVFSNIYLDYIMKHGGLGTPAGLSQLEKDMQQWDEQFSELLVNCTPPTLQNVIFSGHEAFFLEAWHPSLRVWHRFMEVCRKKGVKNSIDDLHLRQQDNLEEIPWHVYDELRLLL